MNEKGSKRRDWVKNAAIVFLTVMLILTFFSNTIMNYSLPEVAVQYVESGTITSQVRGTGTVESDDPYEVKITESRKVTSVAVKEGDTVQKGDVLFLLEDTESEELKAARKTLEGMQDALDTAQDQLDDAWDAYYDGILVEGVTAEGIAAANGSTSANTYRKQITDIQNALKPLEERKAEIEKAISDIDAQMALETGLDSAATTRVPATQKALETANNNLTAADNALKNAQADYQAKETALEKAKEQAEVSAGDAAAGALLEQAQQNFDAASAVLNDAQAAYDGAKQARDGAQADYNNAVANQTAREGSQAQANLATQRSYYEVELHGVENQIAETRKPLDDLLAVLGNRQTLEVFQDAISDARKGVERAQEDVDDAQEEVDRLTEKAIGATVTADISGTVSAINIVAGNTTAPDAVLAELQPEGAGYTMQFSVTTEQARTLSPGIEASLVNAWRYDDVVVTLKNIRPDPQNPSQNKLLVFDVTGSVTDGQSLSVSVGDRSSNYDMIVPNSAIREDSNGTFVLQVESRPSPLSTRYIATRVDVEVIAKDDTRSAITGGLYSYGSYVITTSDNPVTAGQQVRLADN